MKHALPPLSIENRSMWLPLSQGAAGLLLDSLVGSYPTESEWERGISCDPALAGWLLAKLTEQIESPDSIEELAKATCDFAQSGDLASQLVWSPSSPTELEWNADSLLSHLGAIRNQTSLADLTRIASRWLRDQAGCPLGVEERSKASKAESWFTSFTENKKNKQPGDSADFLRHWSHPGTNNIAGRLPTLAARLVRADQIERDFDATLEDAKLRAMKELAYGASHEINNPLANISARAQTLLSDESDPDRQKTLAAINRQAFRAHEMIADMMLFAHPPRLEYTEFAIAELVDEVLTELNPDAERQGTTLRRSSDTDSGAAPLVVTADRVQIGVAVKALTRNSIEALGQGGLVQVDCAEIEGLPAPATLENGVCVITITDDGPGISDEIRQHMFEPFFSGREAGRGLGFGLSKVWRIADQHGGSVAVSQNTATDGAKPETCISIHFPIRPHRPAGEPNPSATQSVNQTT